MGKIGHIKRRLKDFPGALQAYEEELELRRKFLARDPTSWQPRRSIASALDGLGQTLRDSGDLAARDRVRRAAADRSQP